VDAEIFVSMGRLILESRYTNKGIDGTIFMTSSLRKTSIQEHRQKFPGLAHKAYFNFGGQGTMPRSALEAIINAHEYIQQVGPFSVAVNAWIAQQVASLRRAIAQELATIPATITLTENVTTGCNIVLWGIDWQRGDRLLMSDCEHPGIIAIVGEIARRFGVEVAVCPLLATLNEGNPVEVIEQHLTSNTRLVVLSHLLWNTGQVLPLAEIVAACHDYPSQQPVRVLVDAAQSVGSLPLNLPQLKVDYYAFTGHKWLCGPPGVGGLYIRQSVFEELQPTFIGWRGIDTDERGQPCQWKEDGRKFEVATSACPEYEGLRTAIATHQQWGTKQERYQRLCQLSAYLWERLAQIEGIKCLKNSPPEAGLVSFQVTKDIPGDLERRERTSRLVKSLEERGFFLRTIAHPNCIRACVHYLTLPEEIDRLVAEIKQLLH
jgi:L-cysteine/cystine lyase